MTSFDIAEDFALFDLVDRWDTSFVFANYKGVLTTISHEIEKGCGGVPRARVCLLVFKKCLCFCRR
ncbi:MAG: hypothetical protein OHK0052_19290 [Anaerolineales bacterium]